MALDPLHNILYGLFENCWQSTAGLDTNRYNDMALHVKFVHQDTPKENNNFSSTLLFYHLGLTFAIAVSC